MDVSMGTLIGQLIVMVPLGLLIVAATRLLMAATRWINGKSRLEDCQAGRTDLWAGSVSEAERLQ